MPNLQTASRNPFIAMVTALLGFIVDVPVSLKLLSTVSLAQKIRSFVPTANSATIKEKSLTLKSRV